MIFWSLISFFCIIALFTFAKQFMIDMEAGKNIFIPGVSVLAGIVLLAFAYAITRVKKYYKLYSLQ